MVTATPNRCKNKLEILFDLKKGHGPIKVPYPLPNNLPGPVIQARCKMICATTIHDTESEIEAADSMKVGEPEEVHAYFFNVPEFIASYCRRAGRVLAD
jgi:hypothetical protein